MFTGNAEWLYCQTRILGVSSVISDLDRCFQYMNCSETGLIRDALVLMKPSLDFLQGHMGQCDSAVLLVLFGPGVEDLICFFLSCFRQISVLL